MENKNEKQTKKIDKSELLQIIVNTITTLNDIDIKGEKNMSYLLGSIQALKKIAEEIQNNL